MNIPFMRVPFVPQPKPAPREKVPQTGPTARRRASKRRQHVYSERAAKALVRRRDKFCRWPDCGCEELAGLFWSVLEVAHLKAAGAGGDPQLIRTVPSNMILLCRWRHTGPFGLHSGRARIELLTDAGTDGPVKCSLLYADGPEYGVGISEPPKGTHDGETQ